MNRGIFRTDLRNSASHLVGFRPVLKNTRVSGCPTLTTLAQLLPLWVASITCFEQLSFRSC